MEVEQWLFPSAIILVKFLLKLFIDRQVDLPEFIAGVLALPFDIAFLSASLLAGLIILDADQVQMGLGMFVTILAIGIISLFLCRRSETSFAADRYVIAVFLFLANIGMTLSIAGYVVYLLGKGVVA